MNMNYTLKNNKTSFISQIGWVMGVTHVYSTYINMIQVVQSMATQTAEIDFLARNSLNEALFAASARSSFIYSRSNVQSSVSRSSKTQA